MAERATPWRFGWRHALFAMVAVALAFAAQARAQTPDTLTIGSKNFTENRLLAEIMAQHLEATTDLQVVRKPNLGGTKVAFDAVRTGAIDIYPEYTGTGWVVLLDRKDPVASPLRAFVGVQRGFRDAFDLEWTEPFGFSNSYALAMAQTRAEDLGIESISDLVTHQASLNAGVSHEFLNRSDGFPGLADQYGLQLGDVRGMEHGLAYQALLAGRVDVVDTWTTDAKLQKYPVRLLEDDGHFFPPYDAAPVVNGETLRRHPEVGKALAELAFQIDNGRMQALNAAIEVDGRSFESVAQEFLQTLDGSGASPSTRRTEADDSLAGFVRARGPITLSLTGQHLLLTGIAVLFAALVAVPLGIALTRRPKMAAAVLGATGVIQTVPSLALLAFMIPVPGLGLGSRSAIAALFLYALLPIVRNTHTGITGVDASLIDAARGMGLRDREILRIVQLPLAVPTIMAGIRTATVISIGVATLAAFVGAGGLGDPIVTGLQLDDTRLILSGAVPAALLAVLVDAGLARLEKAMTPAGVD